MPCFKFLWNGICFVKFNDSKIIITLCAFICFKIHPINKSNFSGIFMLLISVLANDEQCISGVINFLCQPCLNSTYIICINFSRSLFFKDKIKIGICIPCLQKMFIVPIIVIIKTNKNFLFSHDPSFLFFFT